MIHSGRGWFWSAVRATADTVLELQLLERRHVQVGLVGSTDADAAVVQPERGAEAFFDDAAGDVRPDESDDLLAERGVGVLRNQIALAGAFHSCGLFGEKLDAERQISIESAPQGVFLFFWHHVTGIDTRHGRVGHIEPP